MYKTKIKKSTFLILLIIMIFSIIGLGIGAYFLAQRYDVFKDDLEYSTFTYESHRLSNGIRITVHEIDEFFYVPSFVEGNRDILKQLKDGDTLTIYHSKETFRQQQFDAYQIDTPYGLFLSIEQYNDDSYINQLIGVGLVSFIAVILLVLTFVYIRKYRKSGKNTDDEFGDSFMDDEFKEMCKDKLKQMRFNEILLEVITSEKARQREALAYFKRDGKLFFAWTEEKNGFFEIEMLDFEHTIYPENSKFLAEDLEALKESVEIFNKNNSDKLAIVS